MGCHTNAEVTGRGGGRDATNEVQSHPRQRTWRCPSRGPGCHALGFGHTRLVWVEKSRCIRTSSSQVCGVLHADMYAVIGCADSATTAVEIRGFPVQCTRPRTTRRFFYA